MGKKVLVVDDSALMRRVACDIIKSDGRYDIPDLGHNGEDALKLARRNKYDAIVLDPPSYGRGPKGEIWKMEDDIFSFLSLLPGLLSEDPAFVILNSYTTGLQPATLTYMMKLILTPGFGGSVTADEVGLPVKGGDLILPCGAAGRWQPF